MLNILLVIALNIFIYPILSINDEMKIANRFFNKPISNNLVDKKLKDKNLAQPLSIYYPLTNKETKRKFPLVIFVHGWGADKSTVSAMARYTAEVGFVTVAVSIKKRWKPENWLPALDSIFSLLEKYAINPTSPIYEKIDFSKIALVGHSMGGTGVLHYANKNKKITTVIALHPYNGGQGIVSLIGGENNVLGDKLSEQKSFCLILTGTDDMIALPEKTYKFFENLSFEKSKEKPLLPRGMFLIFEGSKHNYPVETLGNNTAGKYNEEAFVAYLLVVRKYLLATLKDDAKSALLFNTQTEEFKTLEALLMGIKEKNIPPFAEKW
ncbi:MAG: hypothetical protein P1P64_05715 [Treponemataceae bacterium]